jgi:hypothetical protein
MYQAIFNHDMVRDMDDLQDTVKFKFQGSNLLNELRELWARA